jgi:hypothetical protein
VYVVFVEEERSSYREEEEETWAERARPPHTPPNLNK